MSDVTRPGREMAERDGRQLELPLQAAADMKRFALLVLTGLFTLAPGAPTPAQDATIAPTEQVGGARPAASASPTYTAEEEKQDNRWLRVGWRELNLSAQLHNDELKMTNDGLDNQIAKLEGGSPNPSIIALDQFVIDQDKVAIQTANKFAQIWFGSGDKRTQTRLIDAELEFDAAVKKCVPADDAVTSTLEEYRSNCIDLHKIALSVGTYTSKASTVPSVFKDAITGNATAAQKLLRADNLQLKKDSMSSRSAKIKKVLILNDQMLIEIDKQLRLVEISHEGVVKHNNAHPDKPMADVTDEISMMMDHRKDITDIGDAFRQQVADIR